MPGGGRRAVVIGGGFAGLLAARALADHMDTVTIIERDPVPAMNGHRRGAPQARHPHGLLHRGTQAIESLFPGFRGELADVGAASFDFGQGARILFPAGWAPVGPTGVQHLACSRAVLEDLLRQHVHMHARVDVTEAVADGLLWRGGRVTGVRDTQSRLHKADLVVDASGRASRLTSWLTQASIPLSPSRNVYAGLTYVTRLFESDADAEWHMSAEMTYAPSIRRGGLVQRIEDNRVLVTLIGADGVRPPHDMKGFTAYASALRTPHLAEAIATAKPTGETYQYGGLSNQWHLYHRIRSWPDGLIAVGDSIATLNPIYGHGLTVSALEAVALRDMLDEYPTHGFTRKFQRASAAIIRVPWLLASLSDAGWHPEQASPSVRLANRVLRRVIDRVPEEPDLYRRLVRVQNLLSHPVTLGRP